MVQIADTPQTTRGKLLHHFRQGGPVQVLQWGAHSLYQRTIGKYRSRRRPGVEDVLAAGDIAKRFTFIYQTNYWGSDESRSGVGSTRASTQTFATELEGFLERMGIRALFDAPCGDFNWMQSVRRPSGMKYLGGDIVAEMVDKLNDRHATVDTSFVAFNIVEDKFPHADLWLCRECLFHLSFEDVLGALRNFAQSDIEWALLTCNYDVAENRDIQSGAWRTLDLRLAPICLPEPRERLKESCPDGHVHFAGLWHRDDIAKALG